MTHLLLSFRRNRFIVAFFQSCFALWGVIKSRSTSSFSPNWIKRKFLIDLIIKYQIVQFIETGTYLGQTCGLIARRYPKMHIDTVEIDETLFNDLQRRKVSKLPNITFWRGDSRFVLKEVLRLPVAGRTLFWLDGHFSMGITSSGLLETPLHHELEIIGDSMGRFGQDYIIVIDDQKEIDNNPNYPSTDFLESFAESHRLSIVKFRNMLVLKPLVLI